MTGKHFGRLTSSLLLTFLFLFIFIGNLGKIPVIHNALQYLVDGREVLAGVFSAFFIIGHQTRHPCMKSFLVVML